MTSLDDPAFFYNKKYTKSNINPIVREDTKQNLHFNTKFRDKYYQTSSTDFQFNLVEPCNNITSLKLSSISIPNSWYLFSHERQNNRFIIEIDGSCLKLSVHEIIIPDGNYDSESLEQYLNGRYFYQSGLDNPLKYVKFTIDRYSLKSRFEFTDNAPEKMRMNIKFVDDATTNIMYVAGWILGFRYGQYLNVDRIVISEGLYDCGGDTFFYFCLKDNNKNVNNANVVYFQNSTMRHEVLAKIYLIDGKFAVNVDDSTDDLNNQTKTRKYHGPVDLKKFHITILDEFGRKINLNNMDFSFVLEVTKQYRKI